MTTPTQASFFTTVRQIVDSQAWTANSGQRVVINHHLMQNYKNRKTGEKVREIPFIGDEDSPLAIEQPKLKNLDLKIAAVDYEIIRTYPNKFHRANAAAQVVPDFDIQTPKDALSCTIWLTKKIIEIPEDEANGIDPHATMRAVRAFLTAIRHCKETLNNKSVAVFIASDAISKCEKLLDNANASFKIYTIIMEYVGEGLANKS